MGVTDGLSALDIEASPINSLNELFRSPVAAVLEDELQGIFVSYCTGTDKYSDNDNIKEHSRDVSSFTLDVSTFFRFVRDCRLLDSSLSVCDLYHAFLKSVGYNSKDNNDTTIPVVLTYPQFLTALFLLAKIKYQDEAFPIQEAMNRVLSKFVLPFAGSDNNSVDIANVDGMILALYHVTVIKLFGEYKNGLIDIFDRYGNPTELYIDRPAFRQMCRDFGIVPNLLSDVEVAELFEASRLHDKKTATETATETAPAGCLHFSEFVECLGRCALVMYEGQSTDDSLDAMDMVADLLNHMGIGDQGKLGRRRFKPSPTSSEPQESGTVIEPRNDLSYLDSVIKLESLERGLASASWAHSQHKPSADDVKLNLVDASSISMEAAEKLHKVFVWYASFGDPMNVDKLTISKFHKFARESGFLDAEFNYIDLDLLLIKTLPKAQRSLWYKVFTYELFIKALARIAIKKYFHSEPTEAFIQFLEDYVCPMELPETAGQLESTVSEVENNNSMMLNERLSIDIIQFLETYKIPLQRIFKHYSTLVDEGSNAYYIQAWSEILHSVATVNFEEFYRMSKDFNITCSSGLSSSICSKPELSKIFSKVCEKIIHPSVAARALTFPDFVECIARVGIYAYSKYPYNELYNNNLDKVMAIMKRMNDSGGVSKLAVQYNLFWTWFQPNKPLDNGILQTSNLKTSTQRELHGIYIAQSFPTYDRQVGNDGEGGQGSQRLSTGEDSISSDTLRAVFDASVEMMTVSSARRDSHPDSQFKHSFSSSYSHNTPKWAMERGALGWTRSRDASNQPLMPGRDKKLTAEERGKLAQALRHDGLKLSSIDRQDLIHKVKTGSFVDSQNNPQESISEDAVGLSIGSNEDLISIFRYYCSFGERFNTEFLGSTKWKKFLRESNILSGKVTHVDMDLIFIEVIKGTNREAYINKTTKDIAAWKLKLNYDQFLEALIEIALLKTPHLSPLQATCHLLKHYVLPLGPIAKQAEAVPEDVSNPEIEYLYDSFKKPLKRIYDYYIDKALPTHSQGSRRPWSEVSRSNRSLGSDEIMIFCKDFNIIPTLTSKPEAIKIFKSVSSIHPHHSVRDDQTRAGVERSAIIGELTFKDFIEFLSITAEMAYSKSIHNRQIILSRSQKIEALLRHLADSEGVIKIQKSTSSTNHGSFFKPSGGGSISALLKDKEKIKKWLLLKQQQQESNTVTANSSMMSSGNSKSKSMWVDDSIGNLVGSHAINDGTMSIGSVVWKHAIFRADVSVDPTTCRARGNDWEWPTPPTKSEKLSHGGGGGDSKENSQYLQPGHPITGRDDAGVYEDNFLGDEGVLAFRETKVSGHRRIGALADECKTTLYDIFVYYCTHGEPFNTRRLGSWKFMKLMRDCRILEPDDTVFTQVDVDHIFLEALPRDRKNIYDKRLDFEEFIDALCIVAWSKFSKDTSNEAVRKLLAYYILPNGKRKTKLELMGGLGIPVDEYENVLTILYSYTKALSRIYNHYASKEIPAMRFRTDAPESFNRGVQAPGNELHDSLKTINMIEYLNFAKDFNIIPVLISHVSLSQFYRGVPREASLNDIEKQRSTGQVLTFNDFIESLGHLAAIVVPKNPEVFGTGRLYAVDQVTALLRYISESEGIGLLEVKQDMWRGSVGNWFVKDEVKDSGNDRQAAKGGSAIFARMEKKKNHQHLAEFTTADNEAPLLGLESAKRDARTIQPTYDLGFREHIHRALYPEQRLHYVQLLKSGGIGGVSVDTVNRLLQMYEYYCSFADRDNSQYMGNSKFAKFIRDLGLLGFEDDPTNMKAPFTHVDMDLIFIDVAKHYGGQRTTKKYKDITAVKLRINFDGFLECLWEVVALLYPEGELEDGMRSFIRDCILEGGRGAAGDDADRVVNDIMNHAQ